MIVKFVNVNINIKFYSICNNKEKDIPIINSQKSSTYKKENEEENKENENEEKKKENKKGK